MTLGFSRLEAQGFRRLNNIDIDLRPFNVLIGANGSGKSSFLDIVALLSSSASGRLAESISQLGGMNSILTADGKSNAIALKLSQNRSNQAPIDYELRLALENYDYNISRETLTQQRDKGAPLPFKFLDSAGPRIRYHSDGALIEPTWEHDRQETSLAQVPKMYSDVEHFRQLLADVSPVYHALDISYRAPVTMPQTVTHARMPGKNGEDLLSCLYTMRETDRDRYEAVEDALLAALPTFERMDFPPLPGGFISLAWRERGLERPLNANELSEGTLRFLWLVTLLQSPGLPRITLIDEPEVSLHPEMLQILAGLMREATTRTQLVVATHADRLVRFLEPAELIICNRDEYGVKMSRADASDLKEWMKDYSLDQLWSMGRIGARAHS